MHPEHPAREQQAEAGAYPATPAVDPVVPGVPPGVYGIEANDPHSRLIDRSDVSGGDVAQITELMQAMGALREVEDRVSEASLEYMKLGKTDMRALHFLIVAENTAQTVTASSLAAHLGITSASTTKLLDRLERGGHLMRRPHPSDRRSQSIHITDETRTAAMETVGVQHSRRFHAAARLSPAEREVVTRFLRDTAVELEVGLDWGRGETSEGEVES
ncbi:MarR family transcriptional regulator [Corynebacterium sp. YIM 101645]|uniref:MarR family transcriptional regulator n=1 Tax=Corynebacterium lemuris TaxID=1859292 RepID=A0ABT2FUB7_9CORY|nr:MarR family transcriptional regulator [Corynebacterium lemuris]MCS5478817.1 MarR family transcriptional regulator [Corynebacterium lemuris]